jgi:PAS fold
LAATDPLATVVARGSARYSLAPEKICSSIIRATARLSSGSFCCARLASPAGPVRVVVLHADMTERHHMQEQAFLQAELLDQIDVSVILTDLDLTVMSWNAGAERLYGWTAKEAIGRPASETILPPESFLPAEEVRANLALLTTPKASISDAQPRSRPRTHPPRKEIANEPRQHRPSGILPVPLRENPPVELTCPAGLSCAPTGGAGPAGTRRLPFVTRTEVAVRGPLSRDLAPCPVESSDGRRWGHPAGAA